MRSIQTKKIIPKIILVLILITGTQIAPPCSVGTSNHSITVGPKTTKAFSLIPISKIDFFQLFGHTGQVGNFITKIVELREDYKMIRDNFRQISGVVEGITGWGGLDSFFAPVDNFINQRFDPVFALTTFTVDQLEALSKEYNEVNTGNNAGESSASQFEDHANFAFESMKSFFTEPANVNDRLSRLNEKVLAARDCIKAAKGELQSKQCAASIRAVKGQKVGQAQKAMARQTAMMAHDQTGPRLQLRIRMRQEELNEKENERSIETNSDVGAQYQQTRTNYY